VKIAPISGLLVFFVAVASAAPSPFAPVSSDEPKRFLESVTAERIVVDVRVIENAGDPVAGLGAQDFSLRVDGKPAPIESVEWISAGTPPAGAAPGETPPFAEPSAGAPALAGRLIVLFFQTDYAMSRITGQMRMIREALAFLETCAPEDRLAVLSYDSRLKLRQDFTNDRSLLRRAVRRTIYADNVPDPAAGPFPSIAAAIDFHAARRASIPEHALRVIGQALAALPGSKSLLFFGWGIGNFDTQMGLILDHNYGLARAALTRSHTAVFSLDVTSAGSHSLEGGLGALAGDTGGLYVKTNVFPKLAMRKVAHAISGYYLLTFAPPAQRRGRHEMSIRVPRHPQAFVLARPDYEN
jgi:VWFA-related protein